MGVDEFIIFSDFWDDLSAKYPDGWQPPGSEDDGDSSAGEDSSPGAGGSAKQGSKAKRVAKVLDSRLAEKVKRGDGKKGEGL